MFIEFLQGEEKGVETLFKHLFNSSYKLCGFVPRDNQPIEVLIRKHKVTGLKPLFAYKELSVVKKGNALFVTISGHMIKTNEYGYNAFYQENLFIISDFSIKVIPNSNYNIFNLEEEIYLQEIFLKYMYFRYGGKYKEELLNFQQTQTNIAQKSTEDICK